MTDDPFLSTTRMRSAVLLVLLVTLIFTDASPCQEWNNNGYYKFEHRHILSDKFDTNSLDAWTDYITNKRLCDRPLQSFFEKDDEDRVKGICNGRGITYRGITYRGIRDNLCISTETFTVYIVQSKRGKCEVYSVEQRERYVVVACDIDGNQCLPVHYQTQTNEPPQGGEICQPPTSESWYSGDKEWLPFR
ncbi:hypothetical protein DPX16_1664 [Anabarilius grahami]|uniref:Uncharacterized protein n=1 Tax=Anabarilius grahami TaxID=495550 RepID=A0A3N0Y2M0_ANAGA|nr:hypothetical protein DPX16_1664 [Anabarilius grahami]